jgi:hypothetical protein
VDFLDIYFIHFFKRIFNVYLAYHNLLMGRFIFLILTLAFLTSCLKRYNHLEFESDARFCIPLAHGSFLLSDLLRNFNGDSIFQNGVENELIISYKKEDVAKIFIQDLINFPSSINLADETKILNNITLNNTAYHYSIFLSEFIERLSFSGNLPSFTEGELNVFPEVVLGRESSLFLTWEIEDFNCIQRANINEGLLECSLTNNYPAICQVEVEFFDSDGTVFGSFLFNGNSDTGMKPGESEIISLDLSGKSIKMPVFYKITSLHFFETHESVKIDMFNNFEINAELKNLNLEEGKFNSSKYFYQSELNRVNVEFADSVKMKKVKIETANLNFKFRKLFQPSGVLTVYFPNLLKDGFPFSFTVLLNDNLMKTCNFNLDDTELALNNSFAEFNSFEYNFEFRSTDSDFVEVKSIDNYNYSITLQNLKYSYLEGDFGNRSIDFEKNGISLNHNIWNSVQEGILENNPVLTLYLSNPFGIPIKSDFNIKATNKVGESVSISSPSFFLPFPENPGDSNVVSEIEFNIDNSNIDEFIKLPPNNSINLSAKFELNPENSQSINKQNFVNTQVPIVFGIGIKIPVLVKGVFFNYFDTLNFSSVILNGLERAELIFRTKNGIPLSVNLSFTPYDTISNQTIGDELFVRLLDAAKTDASGNVIAVSEAENKLVVEGENLINLKNSNSILINASFISPEDGTKPAKLKNDFGFDLKMILDVNIDL